MIRERQRKHEGIPTFDNIFHSIVRVILPAFLFVPALEYRLSPRLMSIELIIFGTVLSWAGALFVLWAMRVNRHFETHVRIQSERDHHVVKTGPYRFVGSNDLSVSVA